MKTSNLCADIGYLSLNHADEQLCGDHVEVLEDPDGHSTVIVLADGLGSGVKANILSILTSKIISTMVVSGLKLEDAVATIAQTLPVCSVRGVAYSTFTILHIADTGHVTIIQYDNPGVLLLRDGKNVDYPTDTRTIGGKDIRYTEVDLHQDDIFLLFSDGV